MISLDKIDKTKIIYKDIEFYFNNLQSDSLNQAYY